MEETTLRSTTTYIPAMTSGLTVGSGANFLGRPLLWVVEDGLVTREGGSPHNTG